jgi:hypothetical protein
MIFKKGKAKKKIDAGTIEITRVLCAGKPIK